MDSFLKTALLYVAAATWVVSLTLMGVGVPTGFWRPISIVGFVVTALLFAYDRWLWAMVPVKWSSKPNMRGTWRASLESNWNAPGASAGAIVEAYFVVEQTDSKITILMMTDESRSATVTATLEKRDGSIQLVGIFRNEPNTKVRDRSPIHYGGFRLWVSGDAAKTMEGDYWTDRATKGVMKLDLCTTAVAGDFATAQALCT